jgi:hypothetical protein
MPAAATLLAAAAMVGHAWAGRRHQMPAVRLGSIRGDWLSVHASPLHGPGGLSIILVLEEPGPGDAASLILYSHGATGAQAKAVALVLRGYLTKQIVSQLAGHQPVHGPGTPQGGVDNLGVRRRQELAVVALLRPGH